MVKPGTDEKIYPLVKIAIVVDALKEAGAPPAEALRGSHVAADELYSAATRVSLNQVVEVYRNAARLAPHPDFAYLTGLRFHVSTCGMYGFAILSGTNLRQTMRIAMQYHQLATPLVEIFFRETEGKGVWTIVPLPHPAVDARLYKFLVELQFGHTVSLHRDTMGAAFIPSELHVTFAEPRAVEAYAKLLGSTVLFGQPENKLIFDARWLDAPATLGNAITCPTVIALCDELLEEPELTLAWPSRFGRFC
jgi:AraC-type transcriptional regulator